MSERTVSPVLLPGEARSSSRVTVPAIVLGGTGYVAGELLRLLAGHPVFRVAAVTSSTHAGALVADAFPHLAGTLPEGLRFSGTDTSGRAAGPDAPAAVFAATPHGETAALLDSLLRAFEERGVMPRAVDLSADFRFADTGRYEAIYGREHRAPHRAASFTCAVPEHHAGPAPLHATQPGCFTTAVVLAAYPFFAAGLVEDNVFVSAVTGSSGSGRGPTANTHHPERRSAFHAYAPLAHRHEAEMRMLLGAARGGHEPEVEFVPHSGPFVRGIHATLRLTLKQPLTAPQAVAILNEFYADAPFVHATETPPRLTEVVGTNRCRLGAATRGRTLVITSVIDNLVKGAAGGAVQWMNRLFDLPDDAGLRLSGLGVF
jgi:N-acetyl-gamma-glutamyl-phosphate reductase